MELAEALDSRRAKLHVLGPSRASYPEQLPYLITVATNFQHMLIQAMNTLYNGHEAFDRLPALKLATEFVTRNDTFSDCMAKSGVMYDWHHPLPDAQKVSKATHQAATAAKDAAASSIEVSIRAFEAPAVVADLIKVPTTILAPQQQGILQWLDGIYAGSRGLEIGTFQPAMLTNSMRTQTQKWPDIALGYISDMLAICHNFILQTLEVICPQKDVRDRLVKELMPHLKTRYQAAIDRVLELLEIERSQALVTVNPSMNANIDKA